MDIKRLSKLKENINDMKQNGNLDAVAKKPIPPRPKTTSERIMQKEAEISQKKRKISVHKAVATDKQTLYNIFKDRHGKFYGLSKEETIAEFLGKSLRAVFKLKEKEKEWEKIKQRMKMLRKDGMIIIISDRLSQGTILRDIKDGQWGDRTVTKTQFVYFRPELDEAYGFRDKMDKIIEGVDEAGNQTVKITKKDQDQKKVQQVIRQKNEN
jgi:hypothetical protein